MGETIEQVHKRHQNSILLEEYQKKQRERKQSWDESASVRKATVAALGKKDCKKDMKALDLAKIDKPNASTHNTLVTTINPNYSSVR